MPDPDDWTLFEGHRARFTAALLDAAETGNARLCLLGAGACNDVDLPRLAAAFSEIHLVDLDASALAGAVSRQSPDVRARLRPHPGVDLAGLVQKAKKWKRGILTREQVGANAEQTVRAVLGRLPGPFDVVASACVLTQMTFAARTILGERHPMLDHVRLSVVATHLNTLVGLTRPGGTALLVSDVTSSTQLPLEELRAATDLRALLDRVVASGAAYPSARPDFVRGILTSGALGTLIDEPEVLEPWLWNARLERTYLVYALRIHRFGSTLPGAEAGR
jgi:hypothetical protein